MKAILPNSDDHNMKSHIVRVEAEKAAHVNANKKVIPNGTPVLVSLYAGKETHAVVKASLTNSHGLQYVVDIPNPASPTGVFEMRVLAAKVKRA